MMSARQAVQRGCHCSTLPYCVDPIEQLICPVPCRRSHMSPQLFVELSSPLYFVDFLREPVVDEETGETLDAHPSFYEAAPGGLADVR